MLHNSYSERDLLTATAPPIPLPCHCQKKKRGNQWKQGSIGVLRCQAHLLLLKDDVKFNCKNNGSDINFSHWLLLKRMFPLKVGETKATLNTCYYCIFAWYHKPYRLMCRYSFWIKCTSDLMSQLRFCPLRTFCPEGFMLWEPNTELILWDMQSFFWKDTSREQSFKKSLQRAQEDSLVLAKPIYHSAVAQIYTLSTCCDSTFTSQNTSPFP